MFIRRIAIIRWLIKTNILACKYLKLTFLQLYTCCIYCWVSFTPLQFYSFTRIPTSRSCTANQPEGRIIHKNLVFRQGNNNRPVVHITNNIIVTRPLYRELCISRGRKRRYKGSRNTRIQYRVIRWSVINIIIRKHRQELKAFASF